MMYLREILDENFCGASLALFLTSLRLLMPKRIDHDAVSNKNEQRHTHIVCVFECVLINYVNGSVCARVFASVCMHVYMCW